MKLQDFLVKYAADKYLYRDRFNNLGAIRDPDNLSDMQTPTVDTTIDKYQEESTDTAKIKMPGFKGVARPKAAPGTTTLLKKKFGSAVWGAVSEMVRPYMNG